MCQGRVLIDITDTVQDLTTIIDTLPVLSGLTRPDFSNLVPERQLGYQYADQSQAENKTYGVRYEIPEKRADIAAST